MTRGEYRELVVGAHELRVRAEQLGVERLDEAMRAASFAEGVGPILDPTLFQRDQALREDVETMRAVRALAAVRERTPAS